MRPPPALALLAFALGCGRAPSGAVPSPAASVAPSASATVARGPCDTAMPCQLLASPAEAFDRVLASRPRVLGVGETHAQKDVANVASATKRFTELFLPKLDGKASDLVLELWVANGACGKKEQKVAAAQKDVTATQAPTNQNEFVLLGDAAKRLGVQPHVLMPPCDEYERILDAGGGDIDAMLSMIARLTTRQIEALLAKGGDKLIVAYGGAMHNDAAPRPGHEAWSFGPAVLAKTDGRYVELDLIVPELVKDTDAWRAQPWYLHYDSSAHQGETLLFSTGPKSFAIIFPKTP